MIVIENLLISEDIVQKKFVCDLTRCKGACCEEGAAGAPLEEEEIPTPKGRRSNTKSGLL